MATEKRLIDANSVIKKIDHYYNNSPFPHPGTTWLRGLELAVGLLLAESTVDAVEVVHCKDCFANGCCSVQDALEMGDEGYCPKGRKEN